MEIVNNINSILSSCGVAKRYYLADLKNFPEIYRQKVVENKTGLFIYGKAGIGKTHLMSAIVKYKILEEKIKNISMISVPELILEIRNCDESEILDKYSKIDILFLDDLDIKISEFLKELKIKQSEDWTYQIFDMLIDQRYSRMKTTYISSNLSLDEIAEHLDDRISSRIAGMCEIINMKGEDRRLRKQ